MESAKKIIPFILVAIVFAVGGYFVGHGTFNNQGASLYKATPTTTAIAKPTGLGTTGPTSGDTPMLVVGGTKGPSKFLKWGSVDGKEGCWNIFLDYDGSLVVASTSLTENLCVNMPVAPNSPQKTK